MSPSIFDLLLILGFFAIYPLVDRQRFERHRQAVRAGRSSRWRLYREILLIEWAATAAVLGLWFLSQRPIASLGLRWTSGAQAGIAWILVALVVAGLTAQVLAGRHRPEWRRQVRAQIASADALMPTQSREMVGFAAVSLTAGFCEEVLYRGFLFWWLQEIGLGVTLAAAVTVIAFGFAHIYQGWKGVLKTAAVGAVMIALTLLAGSLWPAILLHAMVDLIGGWTAMAARPRSSDGDQPASIGEAQAA